MSPRQLQMLQDPFFQGRDNADLVDVAVDGVPGADPHVTVKKELLREKAQARREANALLNN